MQFKGLFTKPLAEKKKDEPFYLRLVEASTYQNSVAVEAVDKYGHRLSLICRISKEKGVEMYEDVDPLLGFPMDKDRTVVVQDEGTN